MQRVEVITGVERRRYTDEEKARILAEAMEPGATVSGTARKNGISASLLFAWKKGAKSHGLVPAEIEPALLPSTAPERTGFVSIAPVPEEAANDDADFLRVHIDAEIVVEFPTGMDPRKIAAVVRALRSSSPCGH